MASGAPAPGRRPLTLDIHTTTGSTFAVTADAASTVDHLKKLVSKRLKVPKERICLLHRDRQLRDGTLEDNGLADGSRVILLPSVETGLLTQRPENSVMQALESLNDSQVNDFLSGKSPLNLTMRLGDHMMLIQLQLSTYPGSNAAATPAGKARPSSNLPRAQGKTAPGPSKLADAGTPRPSTSIDGPRERPESAEPGAGASDDDPSEARVDPPAEKTSRPKEVANAEEFKSFLCKQDIETLQNAFAIFKSLAAEMHDDIEKDPEEASCADSDREKSASTSYDYETDGRAMDVSDFDDQSPIKSLSNLVSSPLKSSLTSSFSPVSVPIYEDIEGSAKEDKVLPKLVPMPSSLKSNLISSIIEDRGDRRSGEAPAECPAMTDPIAANLTSCLCSTFDADYSCSSNCHPLEHSIAKNELSPMDANYKISETGLAVSMPNEYQMENVFNSSADKMLFDTKRIELISDDLSLSCDKSSEINLSNESPDKLYLPGTSSLQMSKTLKNKRLHYLLHKTSKPNNQAVHNKPKAFIQSLVNKHIKKRIQQSGNRDVKNIDLAQPSTSKSDPARPLFVPNDQFDAEEPCTSKSAMENESKMEPAVSPISDNNSLVEASKNLTQTLKKLSKEVLTNKVDLANEEASRPKIGQGAVIESMKHHGKGIYSGTFSGTLNPALQDRFGRPKRDISTIIHILNDLLCATPPQYRRGARILFEPTHNTQPITRTRQREFKQSTLSCDVDHRSDECECNKCSSLNLCPYGECNGHYASPPIVENLLSSVDSCSCKRSDPNQSRASIEKCSCSSDRLLCDSDVQNKNCYSCDKNKGQEDTMISGTSKNCKKCNLANTLALDNSKTKCKLDQLRLVMQQKKQRREARKIKSAPYPSGSSSAVVINQTDPSNIIAEEIETLA